MKSGWFQSGSNPSWCWTGVSWSHIPEWGRDEAGRDWDALYAFLRWCYNLGSFQICVFKWKDCEDKSIIWEKKVGIGRGREERLRLRGVSLGFLGSLWLHFGAPMFKPSVNKCISSIGRLFPHLSAFPESTVRVPAGILRPCPAQVSSPALSAFLQESCSENGTKLVLNSLLINSSSCF